MLVLLNVKFLNLMRKSRIPELLTLSQACKILQVHPNTLRKWDKKGILKAVRFGVRKDRRYKREDIAKMISGKAPAEKPLKP